MHCVWNYPGTWHIQLASRNWNGIWTLPLTHLGYKFDSTNCLIRNSNFYQKIIKFKYCSKLLYQIINFFIIQVTTRFNGISVRKDAEVTSGQKPIRTLCSKEFSLSSFVSNTLSPVPGSYVFRHVCFINGWLIFNEVMSYQTFLVKCLVPFSSFRNFWGQASLSLDSPRVL